MRGLTTPGRPDDPGRRHGPDRQAAPSEHEVARARRVLAQHRRQRYPHGRSCGWCQELYPCTPRRAAESTMHAAGARRAKPATVAVVPGLSSRQRRDRSTVAQAQMLLLNPHHH